MPESRRAAGTDHAGRDPISRRGRAVATGALALTVVGGIALAAACGSGSGGTTEQRPPGAARPSGAPSPSPTPPWDRHPASVAAVGDSITRGFDACSLLSDCSRASWATGSDSAVGSLAHRLVDAAPARHSWNYAVSGSLMAGLPAQMERAARQDPELVTVLSGANDACRPTTAQMTSAGTFRAGFREALRTLHRKRPEAQVYVSSVPDLRRLWSQGRKDPWGERVWGLGICQSMLRDPQSMTKAAQDRRQAVYDRVVAYNGVLKEECAKVLRCRYDGGAVFHYRFSKAELSRWDWFHPSKAGQRKLADLAYRGITARQEPGSR